MIKPRDSENYTVVVGTDKRDDYNTEFTSLCNEKINNGWIPTGGVSSFVYNSVIHHSQAFIRKPK